MKKSYILFLTVFFFAFTGGILYQQTPNSHDFKKDKEVLKDSAPSILSEICSEPPILSSSQSENNTTPLLKSFLEIFNGEDLTSNRIIDLDSWSITIDNKTYFSRYEESYAEHEKHIDTNRKFKFFWKDKSGNEVQLDVPFSISYINHIFQDLPVEAYPSSEFGNALAIETPYGIMVITSESKYYESIEGVDGYNYYLITEKHKPMRLNNNLQSSSIAFCGKADFSSGDMYYLQLQKNRSGRTLCYINLRDKICQELLSGIDQYAFSDKIFFSKYNPEIPIDISSNPHFGKGGGVYVCEKYGTGVKELLSLEGYVVCRITVVENYLLLAVVEWDKSDDGVYNEKFIVYNTSDGEYQEIPIDFF